MELELVVGDEVRIGEHVLSVIEVDNGEVTFKIWSPDHGPLDESTFTLPPK